MVTDKEAHQEWILKLQRKQRNKLLLQSVLQTGQNIIMIYLVEMRKTMLAKAMILSGVLECTSKVEIELTKGTMEDEFIVDTLLTCNAA